MDARQERYAPAESAGVNSNESLRGILALALTAFLWSTSGIAIKLVSWNPLAISGIRSLIAATLLVTVTRGFHFPRTGIGIAASVSYAATMITFVMANKMTTSANAIFLQYLSPAFVAVFAVFLLREFTSRMDWIILSGLIGGMVLFFLDDLDAGGIRGNILAVVSGAFLALFIVLMRKDTASNAVGKMILGHLIAAAISIPVVVRSPFPGPSASIGLLYLGLVQIGLTSLLYAYAVPRVPALGTSVVTLLEPVFNPIWVFALLGEVPGRNALIGGAVIIGLVALRSVLTVRRESRHAVSG